MRWTALAAVVVSMAMWAATARAQELEPIFNGKDLAGWRVPDPNPFWKVVDGVLVGTNDEKLKGNVLQTQKEYTDVILESDFRFQGEIDSGFYLRKPTIQFQIGVSRSLKKDMTASIYAHGKYPGVAQGVDKLLKPGEWNTMRVEARGSKYTVFLNGQKVLEYEDPAFPGAAPIGLQIHGGLKMTVEFRNIKARALEPEKAK